MSATDSVVKQGCTGDGRERLQKYMPGSPPTNLGRQEERV